jgi:hypothetical protein
MKYDGTRYFVIFPEREEINKLYSIFYSKSYADIEDEIDNLKKYLLRYNKLIKNNLVRCTTYEDHMNQVKNTLLKIKYIMNNE